MNAKIAVVSLWAEDVPQTVRFYKELIGLPQLPHLSTPPHFAVDEAFLVIHQGRPGQPTSPQEPSPEPPFPLLAIGVDDLEAVIARLQSAGIPLPWGIEENPKARWIRLPDPGGNLIEVVQFQPH